jgi:hypothetical protein
MRIAKQPAGGSICRLIITSSLTVSVGKEMTSKLTFSTEFGCVLQKEPVCGYGNYYNTQMERFPSGNQSAPQ